MRSAQNVHPEFGLWSNLHPKAGLAVAFIICGSIAAASGLVLQMAGHDANVDGRSVIAAVPLNPGTTLSTIVSPASLAISAPNSRQGTASPSNSPQPAPLNAIPPAVTASTTTTEPSQQPVAGFQFTANRTAQCISGDSVDYDDRAIPTTCGCF